MNKEFNLNKWIEDRIASLQKEAKRSKRKDLFWTYLLLIFNVATIIAAVFALTFLFLRTSIDVILKNDISLIATIISLIFIIMTFILQIFLKVYASRMRDKIYRIAIDRLKVEIIKFDNKIGVYNQKNSRDKLEEVIAKVEADVLTYASLKPKLRQAFINTATGGKR